jgi:hypothetical protein
MAALEEHMYRRVCLVSFVIPIVLIGYIPSILMALVVAMKYCFAAPLERENWATPRSGELALGEAVPVVAMLRRSGVDTYRPQLWPGPPNLSVLQATVLSQRTIEGAWPIKPDPRSPYYLTWGEGRGANCRLMESQRIPFDGGILPKTGAAGTVSLYDCR